MLYFAEMYSVTHHSKERGLEANVLLITLFKIIFNSIQFSSIPAQFVNGLIAF